jgi:hypothetical protein
MEKERLFQTFFRSKAMMTVGTNERTKTRSDGVEDSSNNIMLMFKQGIAPRKFAKETYRFSLSLEEVFQLIRNCKKLLRGEIQEIPKLDHFLDQTLPNSNRKEKIAKSLIVGHSLQNQNDFSVAYLSKKEISGSGVLVISFNRNEFEFFIYTLSKFLYFNEVGTLTGFNVNWI